MIRHEWYAPDAPVFDFTDPQQPFWLTNAAVEGMGYGERQDFVRELASGDGQTYSGSRLRAREVFWPIVFDPGSTGLSMTVWNNIFWGLFRPGAYGLWRVTNTETNTWRELACRLVDDGYAPDRDPLLEFRPQRFGMTLVADDPWWKGTPSTRTFGVAQNPVEFYNTTNTHVFNIMSSNTAASATITNTGEVTAWPKFRIDGPIDSFDIGLDGTTAGRVAGTFTIPNGSSLYIDSDPRRQTIVMNGDNMWPRMSQVGFRSVAPGQDRSIDVQLNGTGALTVTVEPRFYRAF